MSKFSLEAVLSLTDNLTGPYKKGTKKITALNRGVEGSFKKLGTGIKRGLTGAAVAGVAAISAGIVVATKEFVELDQAVTQAGAKFKDLDTASIDYGRTLDKLQQKARDVASVTEFSATDAAGALDKMAMAGLSSEQAMALLAGTTNLATAAGADLTTAVDIATDSIGAFNLMTDDAVQLESNLARVSDVMAKTTTTANTSLEDMFESIKAGAPAFTAAGQSVESFSALTGVMANAGVKGSSAGTNLRNMMLKLADPTAEAAGVLSDLGIKTQDADGNFRDIIDILGDFETGLEGMGDAQKTAALSTVFGARTVTGLNILLAEGSDKLRDYRGVLEDAGGASQQMADAMRKSISNQIKVLKSGLTELGFQFVEAFEQDGRGALQGLIDLIQRFNPKPVIDFALVIRDILAQAFRALKPLLDGIVNGYIDLANSLQQTGQFEKLKGIIIALKGPLIIFRDTLVDMFGQIKKFLIDSGIMKVFVSVFRLLGAEVKVITGAFKLFWRVAKPILNALGILLKPIMTAIAGIIDGMARIEELKGGIATGIAGGMEERQERRSERREERRLERSSRQQATTEARRESEASSMRNDVFLHAPSGYGMSTDAGGAPSPAVALGGQ